MQTEVSRRGGLSDPTFTGGDAQLSWLVTGESLGFKPAEAVYGNLTLGLNWYPNENLRLLANYVRVLELDRPGNGLDGIEPNIIQVRAQVTWSRGPMRRGPASPGPCVSTSCVRHDGFHRPENVPPRGGGWRQGGVCPQMQ